MKYQFSFSLVLLVLLASITPLTQALNDPALMLYFTFDEGNGGETTGESENKIKGTLKGKAKFVKDGKYGGAVLLEDADSQIIVPSVSQLDITKTITMEAWIFPTEKQNDSNILGRRTAGNAGGYCIQWSGFGKNSKVETWIGLPGWQGTRNKQKIEPELNQWHHIAVTYDGKVISQYVDGKLDATTEFAAKIASQDVEFHIGKAQTGLPSMIGKIDEVAIYERALTQDEVKTDMKKVLVGTTAVDPTSKLATTWASLKTK